MPVTKRCEIIDYFEQLLDGENDKNDECVTKISLFKD